MIAVRIVGLLAKPNVIASGTELKNAAILRMPASLISDSQCSLLNPRIAKARLNSR